MATNADFRNWPSKVVVEGTDPDTNVYIGYSRKPDATLAMEVWLVERIDANGSNSFPTDSVYDTGEMVANHAMTAPAELTYLSRS